METKIKNLGKSQIELEIEVSVEVFDRFKERALAELAKSVRVDGFREGNVPLELVKDRVSEEKIVADAAKLAIEKSYLEAVKENNLEPISQPEVQILKLAPGNPFCFKAVFFVLPQVTLPDYKKISAAIEKKKVSLEEKEIEQAVEWLKKSRAQLIEVSRRAEKGDFVEIEFSSPEIKNNEEQKDAFILGEGHLVKGFEEEIIDLKAGEEKIFPINFPKDFPGKELAGKKIDFKVKMRAVKEMKLPEANDEFAKNLGQFKDLAALKENIRKGLLEEKETNENLARREKILDVIDKGTKMELPSILIEAEKERRLAELKHRVPEEVNVSFEEYLTNIKKTEKELLELLSEEAEKGTRRFLILRKVAKLEKIEVSDEEAEEEANKILARYPNLEKARKEIDLERLKGYTEETLRNEKVFKFLESL